jgi:hypothetical protein
MVIKIEVPNGEKPGQSMNDAHIAPKHGPDEGKQAKDGACSKHCVVHVVLEVRCQAYF